LCSDTDTDTYADTENHNQELTNNNLLSSLSSRIFQELLNPTSNDTFMFDASNNMFYFETILRPNI
jgi:hypothetical protein